MERRTPFDDIERLFDQMRAMPGMRMFEIPAMGTGEGSREGRRLRGGDLNLTMETTDEGYVVLADLPGFEKEEIDLRFDDDTLFVSAQRDVSEERDDVVARRRRSVSERMRVPGGVIADEISATYRNGVLEIVLPAEGDVDEDSHRIHID